MFDLNSHPRCRRIAVLLMALVMIITYLPQQAFVASAASSDWNYAYFRNGSVLKGSDGKA